MSSKGAADLGLALDGWVFVYVGGQSFLGLLHRESPISFLDPFYVFRVSDVVRIRPDGRQEVVGLRRELRAPLGYPELRRMDLVTTAFIEVSELDQAHRAELASLVEDYETERRASLAGVVRAAG